MCIDRHALFQRCDGPWDLFHCEPGEGWEPEGGTCIAFPASVPEMELLAVLCVMEYPVYSH